VITYTRQQTNKCTSINIFYHIVLFTDPVPSSSYTFSQPVTSSSWARQKFDDFVPKRKIKKTAVKKNQNEDCHCSYFSPDIIGTVIHGAHRMGGVWSIYGSEVTCHIPLNYQSLSSYNFTLHNTGSFWRRWTKPTHHKQTRQLTARTSSAAALRQSQVALHRDVRAAYLCLSYATVRYVTLIIITFCIKYFTGRQPSSSILSACCGYVSLTHR
jgi:phenylpropionate dioxygenase-like ring-hydroxylating dioxygenase large terminal subunit